MLAKLDLIGILTGCIMVLNTIQPVNRAVALAITKIQTTRLWLDKLDFKESTAAIIPMPKDIDELAKLSATNSTLQNVIEELSVSWRRDSFGIEGLKLQSALSSVTEAYMWCEERIKELKNTTAKEVKK